MNGNCRLIASLATRLAETATTWARAVAPLAEWVARQLWSRQRASHNGGPPTRLTQSRKRRAEEIDADTTLKPAKHPHGVCRTCGKDILRRRLYCSDCAVDAVTQQIKNVTPAARVAGRSDEAREKASDASRRERKRQARWSPTSQPEWLTEQFYTEKILPALGSVSISLIAFTMGVSRCHAIFVRAGKRRPASQTLADARGTRGVGLRSGLRDNSCNCLFTSAISRLIYGLINPHYAATRGIAVLSPPPHGQFCVLVSLKTMPLPIFPAA